jgi:N-acetylmuramoyl-L-alanine amidase
MNFFKFLIELFTKKAIVENKGEVVIEKQPEVKTRKKVAIIVGHGNGDGGADTWNGSNEYNYNFFAADLVKKLVSEKDIEIFLRDSEGIVGVCKRVEKWNPDISIELHLNSFNKSAHGCEVLCLVGDSNSAELGMEFAKKFTEKFRRTLRGNKGIKWIAPSERGGLSLRNLSKIKQKILVEPFFADNKMEWIEPDVYARSLVEFINGIE